MLRGLPWSRFYHPRSRSRTMFSLRFPFWQRSQSRSKASRCVPQKPRFYRPTLEALEDRIAPATRVWSGGVDGLWSTAINWVGGMPPVNGDTVVFPSAASHKANTDDLATLTLRSIIFSGGGYFIGGTSSNTLTIGS